MSAIQSLHKLSLHSHFSRPMIRNKTACYKNTGFSIQAYSINILVCNVMLFCYNFCAKYSQNLAVHFGFVTYKAKEIME